jgi:LPXTG-motif cell wall-anchored protein
MANSKSLLSKTAKLAGALAVAGAGVLGFAASAHAGTTISVSSVCNDAGKSATTFTPEIIAIPDADDGSVFDFVTTRWTVSLNGTTIVDQPASVTSYTVIGLPSGSQSFDWGDTITFSVEGSSTRETKVTTSHAALPGYSLEVATVATCVEVTTTTAAPTTTIAATTTVAAAVPTTAPAATTTTLAARPPTTATATTAVVQTTAAVSANTLPATGSSSSMLVGAGAAFLALGGLALHTTRRRPAHR